MRILCIITLLLFVPFELDASCYLPRNSYKNYCTNGAISSQAVGNAENLTIRPINDDCYKLCQDTCKSAFQNKLPTQFEQIITLNREGLEDCVKKCQNGKVYEGKARYTNNQKYDTTVDIKTDKFCTESSNAYYIARIDSSEIVLKEGQMLVVSLKAQKQDRLSIPGDNEENTVYLCGIKTVSMSPELYSTSRPRDEYVRKQRNIWDARNASWTDTKIDIKDGDYLSISYMGRYHSSCTNGKCIPKLDDSLLQVKEPNSNEDMKSWDDGVGRFQTLPANLLQQQNILLRDFTNPDSAPSKLYEDGSYQSVQKFGLTGIFVPRSEPGVFLNDSALQTSYNKDQFASYIFRGIIQGFSERYQRLGLRHYEANPEKLESWLDNMGGYSVEINWKGCRFTNGERLEYALVPRTVKTAQALDDYVLQEYLKNVATWQPVKFSEECGEFSITTLGKAENNIFFRIKAMSPSELGGVSCSGDGPCTSTNQIFSDPNTYARSNSFGSYNISLVHFTTAPPDFICKVIGDTKSLLFGADYNGGLVRDFYQGILKHQQLVSGLRAVLIIYLTFSGLAFMLGMLQSTRYELSVRALKIAIVATMTSSQSWDLIAEYFIGFFVVGRDNLANLVTYIPGGFVSTSGCQTGVEIVDSLGAITSRILNPGIWQKIMGLVFSSMGGIVVSIFAMIGIFFYILAIVKVIVSYLISLIFVAMLIPLTPIFVVLLLFQNTKATFDNFIKQLLVFSMQSVFVLASFSLLQQALEFALELAFGFNTCHSCGIGFHLGDEYKCLLSIHKPLYISHFPSTFGASLGSISMKVLIFALIAHATNTIIMLSSEIASRFFGWTFLTMKEVGSLSGLVRAPGNLVSNTRDALGITASAENGRR